MPSSGTHDYQAAREITITITGDIDDLDVDGASLIRMNNASLATIRGIKASYAGKIITITSVGAGQVNLAHQDTNSLAANRLLNFITGGITPLAAGIGTATYQYDASTLRWRLINHNQGEFIDIPHNSANFNASVGTWTVDVGDQFTYAYFISNKLVTLTFDVRNTDVSDVAILRLSIPNGLIALKTISTVYISRDAGAVAEASVCRSLTGNTYIELASNMSFDPFSVTTSDNTLVRGTIVFDVQ